MKGVSISDIAAHLDLSRNTVSKVINGRGVVADETKKRILEAAVALGYKKIDDALLEAYGISWDTELEKHSKNIVVIATAPDFSVYWGKIIRGITQRLDESQYNCFYHFLTLEQEKNFKIPHIIKNGNIAGIIVMNVYHKEAIQMISSIGLPTIYLDVPVEYSYEEVKGDLVIAENRSTIYQITESIIKQGKRSIGFIGDITYCKSIYERWRGYVKALNAHGIQVQEKYCLTEGKVGRYYVDHEIEDALEHLIQQNEVLPEAWVCANDVIATRVMRYFTKKGYDIPTQLMVSGFDDIVEGSLGEKILTSVHISSDEIGIRLAEQMIWRLTHKDRHFEEIKLLGEIKHRKSTGYNM